MSVSLEDELGIPLDASLSVAFTASLVTEGGATVTISPETCHHRPAARCLVIGRQAATADLRIQHGSISRKHALLYYDAQSRLILKDLGSKYGTTVNAERVQGSCILKDGDSVFFGNVRDRVFTLKRDVSTQANHEQSTEVQIEQAKAQEIVKGEEPIDKAGEGLSGRAKRQAEIAAMMASLDETPTYEKFEAPAIPEDKEARAVLTPTDLMYQKAVRYGIPIANRIMLESESERRNMTTCLAVDPAGARFAVGSTDNTLRFFDFGGMDRVQSRSFKTIIPDDGYWPVDCSYSNTGDRILVGTGSAQPIVLDRDGIETVIKFVRGDMYVTDQSKTMGHTAAVTAVDWHPLERDVVLTASMDGSARVWNLNGRTQFQMLVCDKVFQAKNVKGQRTTVTSVCFHPAGREFALGTACGSIQVWNPSRVSARPERAVFSAHGDGRHISNLTYSFDGSKLASRSSGDDNVKVWNAQRFSRSSEPIVTCTGANTVHERANSAFNLEANILCVGLAQFTTEGEHRREMGRLNFYDISDGKATANPLVSLSLDAEFGAVIVKWHVKINQIFVGCSRGQTIIFFDPAMSTKGAFMASAKAGKRVDDLSELLRSRAPKGSAALIGEIITPMYRDNLGSKRKRVEQTEPVTREPERPATGKHKTGSQAAGSINFQQFIADQTNGRTKEIAGKDPREALFKYKDGKNFVERAYEGNKSKLAEKTAEQEDEEALRKK